MSGLAMKRGNPVAVWIGLAIITLGSYHLVWYFKIHKELGKFIRQARRARCLPETCKPGVGTVLMIVFGLGALYCQNQLDLNIDRYQASAGTQIPLYV
ncbi:MAG TPA: DUF4234 domain-containing protein [Pseudonocardiaceae bacterium]|nr:DUF4234 domain-containing protein [Pseudonocardiaceae bacterium]